MISFKLKQHSVQAASFIQNREKEKKKDMEVGVEGGILVPKDSEKGKYLAVQLKFHFGNKEEYLYLTLETVTTFEIVKDEKKEEIKEEDVRRICLPIALTELRKTVRNVTEAYGMPALDLPPFEEETEE